MLSIKKGDELIDKVTFLFPIIAGGSVSLASPSPYADRKTMLENNKQVIVKIISILIKLISLWFYSFTLNKY